MRTGKQRVLKVFFNMRCFCGCHASEGTASDDNPCSQAALRNVSVHPGDPPAAGSIGASANKIEKNL